MTLGFVPCWALCFSSCSPSTWTVICRVLPTCQVIVPLPRGPLMPEGYRAAVSPDPGFSSLLCRPWARRGWDALLSHHPSWHLTGWCSADSGSGTSGRRCAPGLSRMPRCLTHCRSWHVDVLSLLDQGPQPRLPAVGSSTSTLAQPLALGLPADLSLGQGSERVGGRKDRTDEGVHIWGSGRMERRTGGKELIPPGRLLEWRSPDGGAVGGARSPLLGSY